MAHVVRRVNELRLSEEASKLRFFVDKPGYLDAHWAMFIPAIKGQGTEEQGKRWLPMANKMEIIGCYVQTELGHGSNVRELETTSTFDPKADEFIIHSPSLTSYKWWAGGLGKASTHAVVFARLVCGGQEHGVYSFIVQLRSLDDHKPLPGIVIGDIGTTFGSSAHHTMDHGFLGFNHVRIPRNQMLMRFCEVTREGNVRLSEVPKQLIYGIMVYVRQNIVSDASWALSRAVCIAVRYSVVRRQFGSKDGGLENQVIDYKTQQSRLFPLLASAYAFRFVGEWLKWLYVDVSERIAANNFSTLAEAHACTAGLKSLTSITADGIEECRNLCGGHGYLCSSGLPELFAMYVSACTYEGDNVVLLLQVARFLVKTVIGLSSGEKPGAEDWLKPSVVLEAFEARALRLIVACALEISKFPTREAGFLETSTNLVEAAMAHCQVIVVSKFMEKVEQDIPGAGVKEQLQMLCNIYTLHLLHRHSGEFLSTGCITPEQATLANRQLRALYTRIRPNAVALVDAFNYTDHYLGSALGRYDGNVYPALYAEALKDPLNDTVMPDGYHEFIRPILKQTIQHSSL